MKVRKKRKLGTKLIIGIILYAMLNLITIAVTVESDYAYKETKDITEIAFGHAQAAARFIDGDNVLKYLEVVGTDENGKPVFYTDEQYDNVMNFLVCLQAEAEYLLYYYVFIPDENGIYYIWDAYTADDYCPRGMFEPYSEEAKEAIAQAFSRTPSDEKVLFVSETSMGNLATAFYPVYNSDGDPVAVVGADMSVDSIAKIFMHSVGLVVASIAIITLITSVIAYFVVKRNLIRPIEQLNDATRDLVSELDSGKQLELDIHTGDELEELADSFRKMGNDLRAYLDKLSNATTDRERINAEFDIARQIQESVIPHTYPAFPERTDFDIYAALNPSSEIGGDFIDFFLVDSDHLAMVAGDVSYTGVPAALYMIMVVTLAKNRAMQGFSPAEVLQSISEQMLENKMEMFSTIWFAVLELSTGKGIAANAGHQHPALCRAGGKFELKEYRHSPPVGSMEGIRFRDHGFQLYPGDTLFIYSDGVRDAVNEHLELFGKERVLKALNQDPEATPSVLLQTVKSAIDRFSGGMVQPDDLSMLSLKYYGPENQ